MLAYSFPIANLTIQLQKLFVYFFKIKKSIVSLFTLSSKDIYLIINYQKALFLK